MTTNQTTEKKVTPRKPAAVVVKKDVRKGIVTKAATVKPVTHAAAGAVLKFFVFVEGARPVGGPRLKAHTYAALRFLGLSSKLPASVDAVSAIMGPTAINYHKGLGNLAEEGTHITLTSRGLRTFTLREEAMDKKMAAAFYAAITKGKTDDDYKIRESGIHPVSMAIR